MCVPPHLYVCLVLWLWFVLPYSDFVAFVLSYPIIILYGCCFLSKNRKGVHSDGWEGGEYLGEVEVEQIVIRICLI